MTTTTDADRILFTEANFFGYWPRSPRRAREALAENSEALARLEPLLAAFEDAFDASTAFTEIVEVSVAGDRCGRSRPLRVAVTLAGGVVDADLLVIDDEEVELRFGVNAAAAGRATLADGSVFVGRSVSALVAGQLPRLIAVAEMQRLLGDTGSDS